MFDWLNSKFVETVGRKAGDWLGVYLATSGVINHDQTSLVSGAVLALVMLGWSVINAQLAHRNAQVVKAVENSTPETKQAVVNAAPAKSVDSVLKSVFKGK